MKSMSLGVLLLIHTQMTSHSLGARWLTLWNALFWTLSDRVHSNGFLGSMERDMHCGAHEALASDGDSLQDRDLRSNLRRKVFFQATYLYIGPTWMSIIPLCIAVNGGRCLLWQATVDDCEILHHLGWLNPYKHWDVYHQLLQDFTTIHRI